MDFAIAQQERGRNVYILRSSFPWVYSADNSDSWIDMACSNYKIPVGIRVFFYDPIVGFSSPYSGEHS
ncbi:MAG: hypothetical protein GXO29_01355 [Thermotogae bacterium]|nr:hypothetical protein [Thermotogota bacterium]